MSILDASIGGKEGLIASRESCCFLPHKQLWWVCCLTTLAMPTNHELTPHVADKETLLINCHCTLNWETLRPAPSSDLRCFAAQGKLKTSFQSTPSHRHHPAPTAIKTQPLSNCVLHACADQRARQMKMGIAKQYCQGFWRLFGKGKLFGRPLFKQTLRNYQRCVPTPRTPANNVSINKTLSITTLAQYLYPATHEEHPVNNPDLNRALFWKTCTGKKCINFYTLDFG